MRYKSGWSREAQPSQRPLPPLPLLAIFAGVGVATGWLTCQGAPGTDTRVEVFRNNPWYTVWSSISAICSGLWLLLGCVGFQQIWLLSLEEVSGIWARIKKIGRATSAYLVYGVIVAVVASTLEEHVRLSYTMPLAHPTLRVNIFVVMAILGSWPSAVGLWMTRRRASLLPGAASLSSAELFISLDKLVALRTKNERFLAMLSTVVATAVFQTSAFRNAMVGSGILRPDQYAPEFVLLYGALFGLAIAIVYLPSELVLRQAGRILQNMTVQHWEAGPATHSNDEVQHWLERNNQYERLGRALGLDVPILARVQTSLGLFAPVLASLIPTILPH
jgi:hypothetical protein